MKSVPVRAAVLLSAWVAALFFPHSCGKSDNPAVCEALAPAFRERTLVVDGSSVTHPLGRRILCHFLKIPSRWSAGERENVERTVIPDASAAIPDQTARLVRRYRHSGTHNAYLNLIEGSAGLILVDRRPTPDERARAEEAGVPLAITPFAADGLVFVVHRDNPVRNLSLETVRAIWSGRIIHWQDTGGAGAEGIAAIHLYRGDPDAGYAELLSALTANAADLYTTSMLGTVHSIGGDRWTGAGGDRAGFGCTSYFQAAVVFPHSSAVMIAIDGIFPTGDTLVSGEYPFQSELSVVIRQGLPSGAPALLLRDWLESAEGRRLTAEAGYIPLAKSWKNNNR